MRVPSASKASNGRMSAVRGTNRSFVLVDFDRGSLVVVGGVRQLDKCIITGDTPELRIQEPYERPTQQNLLALHLGLGSRKGRRRIFELKSLGRQEISNHGGNR